MARNSCRQNAGRYSAEDVLLWRRAFQIFDVAEAARQECTRTEVVLQTVQAEMAQAIADVEDLTGSLPGCA